MHRRHPHPSRRGHALEVPLILIQMRLISAVLCHVVEFIDALPDNAVLSGDAQK